MHGKVGIQHLLQALARLTGVPQAARDEPLSLSDWRTKGTV